MAQGLVVRNHDIINTFLPLQGAGGSSSLTYWEKNVRRVSNNIDHNFENHTILWLV